jgi:hypothetical protein
MQVYSFPCPHCSATLRLKDRTFVGRQIDCPDCGRALAIVSDGQRGVAAEIVALPGVSGQLSVVSGQSVVGRTRPQKTTDNQQPTTDHGPPTTSRFDFAKWGDALKTPVGIAWTVAAGAALVFLVAAWPFGDSRAGGKREKSVSAEAIRPDDPVAVAPALGGAEPDPSAAGAPNVVKEQSANVQANLERLGARLAEFHRKHEHFPAGTVYGDGIAPTERLSWLATLFAATERQAGLQPLWDRTWNDPLNDRFVRRTIPELQNPAVKPLTGPNRYPATHFVGLAGVGFDAPELPVDHPRAGVFGIDRRTKLSDIKDGAANTLMVAGVTDNPGAWAAGGRGTIRAFTQEPYVNGPDHFGTGQSDGMAVLMADGSVRFVSKQTDPTVFRRMAAMSDGLPLDPRIPGEPGEPHGESPRQPAGEPLAEAPPPVAPQNEPPAIPAERRDPQQPAANLTPDPPAQQPPLEPRPLVAEPDVVPPPPKVIDVASALKQPIRRFEQVRPASVEQLLRQVEEMAAVPVRIDKEQLGVAAAALEKEVALKLENTSVGAILTALVEAAGLTYESGAEGIRVLPGR